MKRSVRPFSRLVVLVGAFVIAAAASGCGGSSSGTTTSGSGSSSAGTTATASSTGPGAIAKDPTIAAEVPAAIASKGMLTVAADATYAPNEFIAADGTTVVGMDVDLGHALGEVMGVQFTFTNASFDTIIPGLLAGKYGIGMSSFTDTLARQQVVDFVTYFSAGTSFYVAASGGATVMSLADLCGKKVGVERGTTQQTDATAQNAKCKATGKPAVQLSVFPDQNGANLALSSGRVEVVMADSPVAAYAVKQSNGHFALSGSPYGTAPYGIAIPKKSGLQKPILDALNKLIANGTYQKILAQWGVQQGAIANPAINAATS
jgi:polar amino acid transport system substrate-binding protein